MQVRIRSVGRESFWSAGRKWDAAGRVVSIVADDVVPQSFLRGTKKDDKGTWIESELDLPAKDGPHQDWVIEQRRKHDAKDEVTASDYAQIRADYKFLAVEYPNIPDFQAVKK